MTYMKKTFKSSSFGIFPTSIMVLFEIPQKFKGHFLNVLRVSVIRLHFKRFFTHLLVRKVNKRGSGMF